MVTRASAKARVFGAAGLLLLVGGVSTASFAADPPGLADWEMWKEQRYLGPVLVPEEGIVWEVDSARFTLAGGEVWLLEPTGSGAFTGVVFEGKGRFEMQVPDAVELRQLRRFARDREMEEIDQSFDRLVLRSSNREVVDLLAALAEETQKKSSTVHRVARSRHQRWLLTHQHDASARVIAGLGNLGDRYLRADLESHDFGWLTFQFDATLIEEVDLMHFSKHGRFGVLESWLSLDRADERRPDGRPLGVESSRVVLEHVDAEVDLTRAARRGVGGAQGLGQSYPMNGQFETTVRLRARKTGTAALELVMHPLARIESVQRGDTPLSFLRYPVGTLDASLTDRFANPGFVVLLDEPLQGGQAVELEVTYELELPGYAPGLTWYPRPRGMHEQPHTGRVALTLRSDYDAIGPGREVEDREQRRPGLRPKAVRRSVWESEEPSRMLGFVFARAPHQKRFEEPGLPPVTVFGTKGGFMSRARVEETSEHVIGSLRFLEELYDQPIPAPELWVGMIGSRHGQAFSGMVQLDDLIVAKPGFPGFAYHGRVELFVAHEVAHQWWGHGVGWASYRDQWLSEAMAEYAAMMYVEAEVDEGRRVFRDILAQYTHELLGSIEGAFGAFARPGVALLNRAGRQRIGPIAHGYRAATAEAPTAYSSMTYRKGALVLHMIRQHLKARTGDDEAFVGLLKGLLGVDGRGGRQLSTELLRERLALLSEADWKGFFDRYVYGTEIPTYAWSAETVQVSEAAWRVDLDVEQTDAYLQHTAALPVLVEYRDGASSWHLVEVEGSGEHTITVDREPQRLVFNPDWSILARVRPRLAVKAATAP